MSASVVQSPSREQLRAGLKAVKSEHEGSGVERQPTGVFGFSYSPFNACPMFANQTYQVFEVHKRADGSKWVVMCVTPEDEALMLSDQEPIEVTLYPEEWEKATKLVAFDTARVIKAKPASRTDGNFIRATLAKL